MLRDLKSRTRDELVPQLAGWGVPAYRADQILDWIYKKRVSNWSAMSNVPAELRERLGREMSLCSLELVRLQGAQDTTRKFLWRLRDGDLIESVLISANPGLYGEKSDRHTLCVSTQVGCAYGCRFCASGLDGWKRNLEADEIVDQLLAVERWHAANSSEQSDDSPRLGRSGDRLNGGRDTRLINNLVIMGMGEPLANYDNLLRALTILNAEWGGGIGARKITVSTSGLVPQIRRLAEEPPQYRLAISLHGATDEVRSQLMPVNRKYPLRELTDACHYFVQRKGQMVTLEYILIAGINDGLDQVEPLARIARRLHAKVNLIPYNRVEGLEWKRPAESRQDAFWSALTKHGISATLRREKGHDIDAACGQLRLRTEKEEGLKAF